MKTKSEGDDSIYGDNSFYTKTGGAINQSGLPLSMMGFEDKFQGNFGGFDQQETADESSYVVQLQDKRLLKLKSVFDNTISEEEMFTLP